MPLKLYSHSSNWLNMVGSEMHFSQGQYCECNSHHSDQPLQSWFCYASADYHFRLSICIFLIPSSLSRDQQRLLLPEVQLTARNKTLSVFKRQYLTGVKRVLSQTVFLYCVDNLLPVWWKSMFWEYFPRGVRCTHVCTTWCIPIIGLSLSQSNCMPRTRSGFVLHKSMRSWLYVLTLPANSTPL